MYFKEVSIFIVVVLMMKVIFFVIGFGYKVEVWKSIILGSLYCIIDDLFYLSQFFYQGVIFRLFVCQVRVCYFGEFCIF